MISKKYTGILFGLLVILFILKFFCPVFLKPFLGSFNGIKYCLVMTVLPFIIKKDSLSMRGLLFNNYFKWYFLFAIVNIISCNLFRDQALWVSYWMWIPFFMVIFYPVFMTWKKPVIYWEKIIEIIFCIFLVCFVLQFVFRKTQQLFVLDTQFEYLEFESRIRIYSDSILYLGSFFCFNRYLTRGMNKYLLLFAIGSVCVFLQGFRMMILCYLIISFLMFVRIRKISFRTAFLMFLLVAGIGIGLQTDLAKDKIEEMTTRNERANFGEEDYVRVLLVDYYYNSHFKNNAELILGSGIPHLCQANPEMAESSYSRECSNNADAYHFYPADMGLVGLSWNAGIPFTICFILLLLAIARTKTPGFDYLYIGAWEIFIVMIGLTNELSYNHANIIYQAIVMVILTQVVRNNNDVNQDWKRLI